MNTNKNAVESSPIMTLGMTDEILAIDLQAMDQEELQQMLKELHVMVMFVLEYRLTHEDENLS